MVPSSEHTNTLSVSQLTGHIQHTLEDGFSSVWVKGEISNLTRHSSGHWYFSLKDNGAQLGAVMFKRQNESVRFIPAHGMEITVHGRISVYAPQGRYQLIIDQMLPAGQGDLHLAFENLKQKLQSEGLFDPALKKDLPKYPERIGIVTSPTGAAIRDIINVFARRYPLAELLLLPVRVQGEGSAKEIADAIDVFNERRDCQVLLIGRGGGSLEDLWAFNEEIVAYAIARSKIPVVSAVGHETDTTISDFVADRRAATPSAGAELIVPDHEELFARLTKMGQSLSRNLLHRIDRHEQRLSAISNSYALKRPGLLIEKYIQKLDQCQDRAIRVSREKLGISESRLESLRLQLNALNPLSILERGYAVLSDSSGKVLRSVDQTKPGNQVLVRISDGELAASINKVNKHKK